MVEELRRITKLRPHRDGYWSVWFLLACSLFPAAKWHVESHRLLALSWFTAAAFMLACAALLHGLGSLASEPKGHLARVLRILRILWWFGMVAIWMRFWLLDLRHARFQMTLLAVPTAMLFAHLIGRIFRGASSVGGLAVGAAVGLGVVWALMAGRSDNGCTGVSSAYALTQAVTLFGLYLFGPVVLASSLTQGRPQGS